MIGYVAQGMLVNDTVLKIVGTNRSLKFKSGLPVYFGDDGVNAGTLAESARLPNPKERGI